MKAIIGLLMLITITFCGIAQGVDSATLFAATYFRQADSASSRNAIWKYPLYGPMLLVDSHSRTTYANIQDSAGTFTSIKEGIYKGKLPQEVMIANTSINWQGRLWSMMLWPLPVDREERLSLMLHESFHRIQHKLGIPAQSPTIDHLATTNGRIFFLLELQALKAALARPVDQRKNDLVNALLFRKKRQELFPLTFDNERLLEMNEGLAEYTGVLLGRLSSSIRQHLYNEIDKADTRLSLIRSMAYITGPVYGYLLYEKSPGWTKSVASNSSFPALIKKYYKLTVPEQTVTSALAKLERQYKGENIKHAETMKEKIRRQQEDTYKRLFTHQPVLIINLEKMNIVFNPNNLFDLGELGTVYPTAEINDVWGNLKLVEGGMLMKNWKVIILPTVDSVHAKDNIIRSNGWELQLNKGWRIEKMDSLQSALIRKE
ncbi:hypothetical protein SAMN05421788_107101 [Filimonas lacunae]|uniref:Uncharacterized protein n=1 Tax=Filimonas lacunae TaxID=477680 RepID=A0A173MG35_9BACT|nr:hypothetical protein [Filimonas lacunae]BAV06440.1 hypothetical protein FLA_2459 [Filimonas lacunae]SIT26967.1 hypothetical protein SAMN05421788_107101 [Filimonas lacunae]